MVVSDIKKKHASHFLHIETPDVVEILNATSLYISETFKDAKQEVKHAKIVFDKIETFKIFTGIIHLIVCNSVDRIIKVHPKWASMTVGIMFIPGPIVAIAICILWGSELLCDGTKLSKFMLFFYLPMVTLCFPLGVLITPIFQALATTATGFDSETTIIFTGLTELVVGFEACLESAPQVILQLYIIFSSGLVSTTQKVSISCFDHKNNHII